MSLKKSVDEVVSESENPLLQKHKGWNRKPLEELADIETGKSFESDYFTKDEGIPLIRIRDIDSAETEDFYNNDYDERYLVEKGDILVGMDGDFDCAIWKGPEGLLNQRVARIRPNESIYDKKLLKLILQPYLDEIHTRTSSTTVKHLSVTDLRKIPIPVPPLKEQKRIVSKIEELFTKLDSGKEGLEESKVRMDSYRRSILEAAMNGDIEVNGSKNNLKDHIVNAQNEKGNELSEEDLEEKDSSDLPDNWIKLKMEDLIYSTRYGTSEKCDYENEGYPVLRIPNIRQSRLLLEDMKYTEKDADLSNIDPLSPGDFLVIRTNGSEAIIGRAGLIEEEFDEPHYFASYLIRFRILPFDPLPQWINLIWNSHEIRSRIVEKSSTSAGQFNLSQTKIKNFEIPLPPLDVQKKIIEEVNRKDSLAADCLETVKDEIKRSDRLRQSILKKAVRGDLVPQKEGESANFESSSVKSNETKTTTQTRLN